MTYYRIHPAIGVARVGDSPEYYLAPETAGGLPTIYSSAPTNLDAFRDKDGKLLKQGVRFKLFRYDSPDSVGVEVKVGQGGISHINWFAYPANKKASWFQFQQQTGSGQGPYSSNSTPHPEAPYAFVNDKGYDANNAANPYKGGGATDAKAPSNPLRYNLSLGTSEDPATINDDNRRKLILDPGNGVVSNSGDRHDFNLSASVYPFLPALKPNPISHLGSILVDSDGDLIFLPGDGNSGTTSTDPIQIKHYANNEGWFDDTCDGPIEASINFDDGSESIIATAWVVVGPPAYAPQVLNQVTMYDNMYDTFVRKMGANPALYSGNQFNSDYTPSYPDEIAPILSRPDIYQYVCNIPVAGTKPHRQIQADDADSFKDKFFEYIRQRGLDDSSDDASDVGENQSGLMPFLAGDNPISNLTISKYLGLTETQYFFLSQYSKGLYTQDPLPAALSPGAALDKAALSNCVGGAFSPGIEITWITRNPTIYQPLPNPFGTFDFFRINVKNTSHDYTGGLSLTNGSSGNYGSDGLEPGDLTKYMAQPWQADFNECSDQAISNTDLNTYGTPPNDTPGQSATTYWWWPAQRPYSVFPQSAPNQQVTWTRGFIEENGANLEPSDIQMVTCWKYLGFIVESGLPVPGPRYWEVSRQTKEINTYTPPQPPPSPPAQHKLPHGGDYPPSGS
jgi:hypothetical protein